MFGLALSARMMFIGSLVRDVTSEEQLIDAVHDDGPVCTGMVGYALSVTTVNKVKWDGLILVTSDSQDVVGDEGESRHRTSPSVPERPFMNFPQREKVDVRGVLPRFECTEERN